jgi:2,3,4,5-tetrahydropyridine-2-carboxylate N-succinyltransferase
MNPTTASANPIREAFDNRDRLRDPEVREAVEATIAALDRGEVRVAEKRDGAWEVNEWVKQAILLYFAMRPLEALEAGDLSFFDKVPPKRELAAAGIRVVPPGVARYGSFLEPGCVLMPGLVGIGPRPPRVTRIVDRSRRSMPLPSPRFTSG